MEDDLRKFIQENIRANIKSNTESITNESNCSDEYEEVEKQFEELSNNITKNIVRNKIDDKTDVLQFNPITNIPQRRLEDYKYQEQKQCQGYPGMQQFQNHAAGSGYIPSRRYNESPRNRESVSHQESPRNHIPVNYRESPRYSDPGQQQYGNRPKYNNQRRPVTAPQMNQNLKLNQGDIRYYSNAKVEKQQQRPISRDSNRVVSPSIMSSKSPAIGDGPHQFKIQPKYETEIYSSQSNDEESFNNSDITAINLQYSPFPADNTLYDNTKNEQVVIAPHPIQTTPPVKLSALVEDNEVSQSQLPINESTQDLAECEVELDSDGQYSKIEHLKTAQILMNDLFKKAIDRVSNRASQREASVTNLKHYHRVRNESLDNIENEIKKLKELNVEKFNINF